MNDTVGCRVMEKLHAMTVELESELAELESACQSHPGFIYLEYKDLQDKLETALAGLSPEQLTTVEQQIIHMQQHSHEGWFDGSYCDSTNNAGRLLILTRHLRDLLADKPEHELQQLGQQALSKLKDLEKMTHLYNQLIYMIEATNTIVHGTTVDSTEEEPGLLAGNDPRGIEQAIWCLYAHLGHKEAAQFILRLREFLPTELFVDLLLIILQTTGRQVSGNVQTLQ